MGNKFQCRKGKGTFPSSLTQLPHCHTAIAYFLNCRATHTMNAAHATMIIKRRSLSASPECHVYSCRVMCPLSPIFIYNFLNVIIYLMPTWLTQTTSSRMFYHPLYADIAHPYIYNFLNVLCIYADLYHPYPSYVQMFYLHQPLYDNLAHPYIFHFLNIHVSMPTYITQTPSCVQIFDRYHPLYADLAHPYIYHFLNIHVSMPT